MERLRGSALESCDATNADVDIQAGPQALRRIVDTARMLNRRRDLTGVLAFSGSHFLQVLEGDGAVLDALLESLRRDPRHDGLRVLGRTPISARRFGDWAMALVSSPELGTRIEALAGDAPEAPAHLAEVLSSLVRHAHHRDDGASSRYTPF